MAALDLLAEEPFKEGSLGNDGVATDPWTEISSSFFNPSDVD
jgi:hypothetical protein